MPSFTALLGVELNPASPREKLLSALGGFVSLLLLLGITHATLHRTDAAAVIASMGASAVLLFAVPHGSLSQPWPVLGGHVLSALAGVFCARHLSPLPLAAASAVGLSILVMHLAKCIHPPGGATALTAVLGGPAIQELGYHYVTLPVLGNALTMVALAVLFNACFAWRRYPAALSRPVSPSPTSAAHASVPPTHEHIVEALRSLDTFVDITEEDLLRLVELLRAPQPLSSPGLPHRTQAATAASMDEIPSSTT